jgi:DNA-binding cell septation regulator SpoVG
MEVTDVKFNKVNSSGSLLGFASVEFDGILTIKGFTVMTGQNGMFVKLPSTQDKKDPKKFWPNLFVKDMVKTGTNGNLWWQKVERAVLQKVQQNTAQQESGEHNQAPDLDDIPF